MGDAFVRLALTVSAAALSYRFVEVPARRGGLRAIAIALASRGPAVQATTIATVMLLDGAIALGGGAILIDPGKTGAELAIEQGRAAIALAAAAPRPAEQPSAAPPPAGGNQIYAIGDSVMLAAAPELQAAFPGITIDAEVSRPLLDAPAIVQSVVAAGALRPILIIGLGTNGPIDENDFFDILHRVGPKTELIVVNTQAPRDWIPGVNAMIADFASHERNVQLANWHDTIAPRIDELNDDQIHPGGPISGGLYFSATQDALQRLAELRPVLSTNDDKLIERPV